MDMPQSATNPSRFHHANSQSRGNSASFPRPHSQVHRFLSYRGARQRRRQETRRGERRGQIPHRHGCNLKVLRQMSQPRCHPHVLVR